MNTNVMAAGMASAYFDGCESSGEPGSGRNFSENMRRYFEYVRDHDLCLTHALTNPQVNRGKQASELPDPYIAMGIVEETSDGVIVRGARMLATLPIADEILIFPRPSSGRTATAAATPSASGCPRTRRACTSSAANPSTWAATWKTTRCPAASTSRMRS